MKSVCKVAKILWGSTMFAGLVIILTACSGAAPTLRPVAESTATLTSAQPIAATPTRAAPGVAPAPAQSAPAIAPAPEPGAPGIAPAPPGAVADGSSSAAVGAPAVSGMAPAPAMAMPVSSVSSFQPEVAPAPAADVVHGIVVSGSGLVNMRPDRATVTAGVQTQGRTAQEAQSENNQTMNAVIAAIKALGIPANDIQTVGVSLYPIFNQGQTVSGYTASNNVTVIVENIDQAGPVLDAAVKAGANQSSNVTFGLKDESSARNKALALAAADAKSKADSLAGALGLKITGVQSVTESSSSTPPRPYPMAVAAGPSAQAIPIQPGELGVTAQVTIVFSN